jgi:hypothetical protein
MALNQSQMLSAKQLLLQQTADAFAGASQMSIMASLAGITQDEASWRPDETVPTAEQIVRHVAWAKSRFCQQGFATPTVLIDQQVNDDGDSPDLPWEFPCGAAWGRRLSPGIAPAIELLQKSHRVLTQCLEACPEQSLDQPIPTRHGKSAAHFFWFMFMHDLYHAGQIRTRRTLYRATTHPSA